MPNVAKVNDEKAQAVLLCNAPPDGRATPILPLRINYADLSSSSSDLRWVRHDTNGRHGAEIAVVYESDDLSQRVAFVRCVPGAFARAHLHRGHETFHVLSGTFHDDHGEYGAGDIIVYPPQSTHGWTSPTGALILAVWGGPVSDVDALAESTVLNIDEIDVRNCYPFAHTV